MKKIFIDANIVIDYIDIASKDHSIAERCILIIRNYFRKPLVSPITFIITNFLFSKLVKNKQSHRNQMQFVFSEMEITPLQPVFINSVFETNFIDLEDGLQYQCALNSKADLIVTKDLHDYFDSKIPVVHPHDFVMRYNKIFEN